MELLDPAPAGGSSEFSVKVEPVRVGAPVIWCALDCRHDGSIWYVLKAASPSGLSRPAYCYLKAAFVQGPSLEGNCFNMSCFKKGSQMSKILVVDDVRHPNLKYNLEKKATRLFLP